jgi:hypothetical protein
MFKVAPLKMVTEPRYAVVAAYTRYVAAVMPALQLTAGEPMRSCADVALTAFGLIRICAIIQ